MWLFSLLLPSVDADSWVGFFWILDRVLSYPPPVSALLTLLLSLGEGGKNDRLVVMLGWPGTWCLILLGTSGETVDKRTEPCLTFLILNNLFLFLTKIRNRVEKCALGLKPCLWQPLDQRVCIQCLAQKITVAVNQITREATWSHCSRTSVGWVKKNPSKPQQSLVGWNGLGGPPVFPLGKQFASSKWHLDFRCAPPCC